MTQNQLAYQANLEAQRANLAREEEMKRSNLEKEQQERKKTFQNTFINIWRTLLGR